MKPKKPLKRLLLKLGTKCNLSCPHCHQVMKSFSEHPRLIEWIKEQDFARITFSGGEPFAQAEGYAKLARLLKEAGYEVASYSGYTFEQLLCGTPGQKELLRHIDVLIDGPFIQAEKSLEVPFRGSKNQRILDVPASLAAGKAVETTSKRWLGEY